MHFAHQSFRIGLWWAEDSETVVTIVYADADEAWNITTEKPMKAFLVMGHGPPVSWGARKTDAAACSRTEAEYTSLCMASLKYLDFADLQKAFQSFQAAKAQQPFILIIRVAHNLPHLYLRMEENSTSTCESNTQRSNRRDYCAPGVLP